MGMGAKLPLVRTTVPDSRCAFSLHSLQYHKRPDVLVSTSQMKTLRPQRLYFTNHITNTCLKPDLNTDLYGLKAPIFR